MPGWIIYNPADCSIGLNIKNKMNYLIVMKRNMWNVKKIIATLAGGSTLGAVVYAIGCYSISAVLLFSGITKIIDPWPLIETLKLLANMPEHFLIAISAILPIIEITLAITLILKIKPNIVLYAILALFASFLLFSVYGTIIGLKNNCGCFGSLMKSEIGWWMIFRNLVLLGAVIILIKKNKLK